MKNLKQAQRTLRFSAALVAFLLPAIAAHARVHKSGSWADSQFAAAEHLQEALEARPTADRARRDYERVINAYRRVYLGAPSSSKADPSAATAWHQAPDLTDLSPGEVGGFAVADLPVLACRIDDQIYAYRDYCPVCERSLAGAALHRAMGGAAPVLRCPRCHAHFDVVHAGACIDHDSDCHLDPLPLLTRDGVLSIAVPAEAMGAPA